MDDICDRIKEINQQISDSFYKKDPNGVFLGEESAVCNEYGHIEFVKKELCLWDMNGALGLILAKDKPVERSKFRMTGFSPELKAVMIQLSQDASERSCYPNIIEYNTMKQSEQGGYKEDDFQTECKTWAILMQLLAHGYSLVDKEEYMSINAKMLPKIIQDEINEARGNFINHLAQDNDDWDDVEELDITHEDKKKNEKPAKKTRKNKKK